MIFGKRPSRFARGSGDKSAPRQTPEPLADRAPAGDPDLGPAVIRTPPMKPFARSGGPARPAATPKPAPAPVAPPQRPAEVIARHAPRGTLPDPRHIPGHTLVVGRDIRLTGEIRACQRLVVEGSVEAELTDTRTLEISETGQFRGSAAVGECVVSGAFDGDLTVSGLLAVKAGGRVGGAIRYAEIEVERGGRITGRADLQGPQEVRGKTRAAEPHAVDARSVDSRPGGGPGLRPA